MDLDLIKPGIVVRIRSWNSLRDEFGTDDDGDISFGQTGRYFSERHNWICNERFVVGSVSGDRILLDDQPVDDDYNEDIVIWPEMLEADDATERYGFTIGDIIHVRPLEALLKDFSTDSDGNIDLGYGDFFLKHSFCFCDKELKVLRIDDECGEVYAVAPSGKGLWLYLSIIEPVCIIDPIDLPDEIDTILVS
ncbi:MAG: hypothetical protein IJV14_10725 [Lachnospiraceae bacterium]|nr:hypothetical protein [Lachnospiraceae bacterium]